MLSNTERLKETTLLNGLVGLVKWDRRRDLRRASFKEKNDGSSGRVYLTREESEAVEALAMTMTDRIGPSLDLAR